MNETKARIIEENGVYTYLDRDGNELHDGDTIINPCPYACQTIADNLYNSLRGLVYQPFSISGAIYNPKAELGDVIRIGNIQSILMAETLTFDVNFRADAEAPGKDEMEDEYPYSSEILRLQQSTVELKRNDERLRTSIEQTQSQVSIIAENYVGKDGVRSAFALDPSNIVLEAGVDEDDNPTGTITMKAGTLIIEGDNFSVDEDGHMECNGAKIRGDVKCGDDDGLWAELVNGELKGGCGSSQRGSIDFAAATEDLDTHRDRFGIQISGDVLRISTNKIAVSNSSDISVKATWTVTQQNIPIVTDICNLGDGRIGWRINTFSFINGMLTGAPDPSDYYYSE